jgi:hypothetical protein
MLTIQRSFFPDKKAALQHGLDIPVACSKVLLYQLIAQHLGIDTTGIDDHVQLMDLIDAKNIELACVGVAEKFVETEATVLDQMAANIDHKPKPVLRRDRQPVAKPVKRPVVKVSAPKPIKRNKPVVKYVTPMARALMAANLVQVN